MRLSAPKFSTWLLAVIAGGVGVLQHFHVLRIDVLAPYSYYLLLAGFVLLVLAALFKKM
jgi:hypothetical protein